MMSFVLSFLAGTLTSLSPCVLPALPIVVGSALLRHRYGPLAVAVGMTLSFTLFGVVFGATGTFLGIEQSFIRLGAATLIILSGLILLSTRLQTQFARLTTPLATRSQSLMSDAIPSGLKGQIILGVLLGAVWTPCSGPTLGAAIGLAAQQGSEIASTLMMFLFGVGASLPLLAIAYGSRKLFTRKREKLLAFGKQAKAILGAILVVMGALIVSNLDRQIEAFILELLPSWFNNLSILI